MPNVRCPRCSAVAKAAGTHAVCGRCGLTGRIDGATPTDGGKGPSPAASATAAKPGADEKHPLQFTIDLRKVSPAYWSGGTKATAVFILLVGAFALGGFAGMAFEKTRNDLDAGIDDVKSLPGGQQGSLSDGGALANNDSDAGGASLDPVGAGTNASDDGASDPDPSDDPGPNTTEADDPGGEGAPSGQERSVLAENGVGEWESPAFTTEAPLLQIDVDYWGDRFFVLKFLQEGEVKPAATVAASDQGDYVEKTRYISLAPGNYTLRVDLGAGDVEDGPWTLAVTEPVPDQALDPDVTVSDRGDGGVGPVRLTGDHTFSFYSSTEGAAHAKVYTAAGVRLKDCSMSGTATSTEPVDETASCSVDGETWVFIDVAARTSADGSIKWTLDIE